MQTSTLRRIFKAFQYRDFRLMWIGACTSSIGTWMQIVAQGWLIYRLSHSAFLLALDQFLGGHSDLSFLADRRRGGGPHRAAEDSAGLAVHADGERGMLTVLVAIGVGTCVAHPVSVVRVGTGAGVWRAGISALIPTLVDREDMPNAIALNSIQFNLAVTIGPALAGQALAKLGEKWCFGLNALSFLAPIISLSMITARYLAGEIPPNRCSTA